ncbi:SDR family oxidoreductase [Sphingobium chungbukense]|uniref:SDR family oxidoreductase n=1 Tax=Sphingobium chungbukense TaxID=56193 RepID=UPI001E45CE3F|nr:SDR family oxidoreductase [Sphingobium chungbukense]
MTGAAAGIGRAIVRRYLAEGANVVAVVRKSSDVEALEGEGCAVVLGDVSHYETAEKAVATAVERWGGLDVYVANAGLWDFHKRTEKQSPEELSGAFEELFGVNVKAALFGARASIEELRRSRGSVIATGSNACFMAGGGGALYTASKFALRGLVMQLAKEFAPEVRVNGVAPGATDTGISGPEALGQREREMNGDPARMDAMAAHMLLGRVSGPEEHAALYVLLASKSESSYVTGAMLLSDGGLTISI